jgi:choice-of-anchor C domain-containing protein
MKRSIHLWAAALAAVVTVASAAPASASTGPAITDAATFETPVVAPNTFTAFFAGEQMGAWTVTRGDVHLIGEGFWQAADGVQSLDLDGGINGGVARNFPTIPLLTYRVSYALAGNFVAAPVVKTGKVLVNGSVRQQFSFDTTGATSQDMNYTEKHVLFVATGFSATVEFVSTTSPQGWGPVIDDVDVVACLLPVLC